ncbi:MAG: homocysteine S-methyltransferase family protein [Deltaproteobacteria bacterium]|nr:homocysteine S-methyltransferase family protein [Deltaproteobacteria bacterium]
MNRNEFNKLLQKRILVLDGAYGTEFFKMGYGDQPGVLLNLKHPEVVEKLQKQYVAAGSNFILTNTFSANRPKLKALRAETKFKKINTEAVKIAKRAAGNKALVLGDISSTGEFPEPMGSFSMGKAVDAFAEQAQVLHEAGVDGFIVETISDLKECKAAVLGIRKVTTSLPLIVQMTFAENMRSVTGSSVAIFASWLNDLDVDCVGVNCSLGPEETLKVVKELAVYTNKFISVEPNAGTPKYKDKNLYYDLSPADFAPYVEEFIAAGANIVGGCCGTDPEHIKVISHFARKHKPLSASDKILTPTLSSRTHLQNFLPFTRIGEKINPASSKKFQQEIRNFQFDRITSLASVQKKAGCEILDLNLGIEKLLTAQHFVNLINELDRYSSLPLSLDIQSYEFLEKALFEYTGRPLINSARCFAEDLDFKGKLLKTHGGMLILLAMGKKIPKTAEARVKKILEGLDYLEKMGISSDRVLADPLVMAFGAGKDPGITLKVIRQLNNRGIKTTMGLSNLSFGMKNRDHLNGVFLAQAVENGLTSTIVDPTAQFTANSLQAALTLRGNNPQKAQDLPTENTLVNLILSGDSAKFNQAIETELENATPLEVSQNILGKAMHKIGVLYSKNRIFLPDLMLAAQTAIPVFDKLNSILGENHESKGRILLATVKGDVHDIGKKIVGTVLQTSGYEIIDLGKDVEADRIYQAIKQHRPHLLGLSAMMSTTVGEAAEVVSYLRSKGCRLPVIAGGASMNEEIAIESGCAGYAKDASKAVTLCHQIITR